MIDDCKVLFVVDRIITLHKEIKSKLPKKFESYKQYYDCLNECKPLVDNKLKCLFNEKELTYLSENLINLYSERLDVFVSSTLKCLVDMK